ncbi:MAG: hypothetical protein ACJ8AD_13230 [Gemmatimonadaceae bacterium]
MFIELVDALRCPVPHEESWLVASADRMEARHIVEGTLGCPVCRAEYPIRRGVVDFRREPPRALPPTTTPDAEQAMRLAAFLDLSDATGFAVLVGARGAHAPLVRAQTDTPLVVIDPPENVEGEPGISVLRCDGALPLAAGAARGVAIDDATPERVASAVRATRVNGRVVAPASTPLPDGVRELARDRTDWVAERQPVASPVIALHVRRAARS